MTYPERWLQWWPQATNYCISPGSAERPKYWSICKNTGRNKWREQCGKTSTLNKVKYSLLLLRCVCVCDLGTEVRQKLLDGEKQSRASSQLQMRIKKKSSSVTKCHVFCPPAKTHMWTDINIHLSSRVTIAWVYCQFKSEMRWGRPLRSNKFNSVKWGDGRFPTEILTSALHTFKGQIWAFALDMMRNI